MNRVLYLSQTFRAKLIILTMVLLSTGWWGSVLNAQGLVVSLGADQTICGGSTTEITAFVSGGLPPYIFLWSNGQTTPSIRVSPSATTTYSVTVTDNGGVGGVSESASVTVNVERPYQMSCNDHIQVSLNDQCQASLNADMILEGGAANTSIFTIEVRTIPGNLIHPNAFDVNDIGKTFQAQVYNVCGNSCWGMVSIEDKLPPEIMCRHDSLRCKESLLPEDRGFPFPATAFIAEKLGDKKYRVSNWDACTDVELSYDDSLAQFSCDEEFTKVLYRRWYAVDASGNYAICYDTFSVYKPNIEDDVMFPPSYDGFDEPPFYCLDLTGYPTPDITGVPIMSSCHTLQATYVDTRIDVCGASYKILRKWTILDWCSSDLLERYQVIKIVDDRPPVVECPDDFTVSTDVYTCTGSTFVPEPTVTEECSRWDYEVFYKPYVPNTQPSIAGATAAVKYPNGRYYISNLPLGMTWVFYRLTDACGNYVVCTTTVEVRDAIPPIPICDEHTVVSLTLDGTGKIFAETFSDLSYDNCGIDDFEVRRMDSACVNPTIDFGPYAFFCCEDIGESHMVEFRVWDLSSNSNTCMVEVDVQDKIPPTVVCPPNITVSCRFDFFFDELDIFGRVVTDVNDRDSIVVDPQYYNNGFAGFDGYAIDACSMTIMEDDSIDLKCGQGTIMRTFTAVDPYNNSRSCTQIIYLEDPMPFNSNGLDISFPNDTTINGCIDLDTKPSNTGAPVYRNDRCAQVAATYKDLVLSVVDSACYKVLRTWTVLDWCQYDPNRLTGIWTDEQIIKVQNTMGPVLEVCNDTVYCDNNAIEINGVCSGYAELIQQATDDCTPVDELEWRFRIDIFNDGTWDTIGFTNDARGYYPVGEHRIHWIVSDKCDNESSCSYIFEVRDCKPPTPYCLNGITTVVMPSNGCITIWASDFDAGSYDNCTDQEDLIFSFSIDTAETSRTWCCDSMITGNILTRSVRIYVTDEYGNQDYCNTYIVIRDNDNICPDSLVGSVKIFGTITSRADDQGIDRAKVNVEESSVGLQMKQATTQYNGDFTIDQLPMHMDYRVFPEKNDDLLNGVSTADIIEIQRHILGIDPFGDPLDLLSADINKSGHVSAKDLTELRKAILGLNKQFPNNKSWRFIPEGYIFQDPMNPWDCEEAIELYQVENDQWSKNFTGIKVGDLNGNAKAKLSGGLSTRTTEVPFILETKDQFFESGTRMEIPVRVSRIGKLAGIQMTVSLNTAFLELEKLTGNILDIRPENLGLEWKDNGVLTISWNELDALDIKDGEVLFTITAYTKTSGRLSDHISINSDITEALFISGDLQEQPLELRFNGTDARLDNGYVLMQNRPNPFEDRTAISFILPKESDVTLTLFDVTGKVVYRIDRLLPAGTHTEWIDREMVSGAGIYYYQLDAEGYTATRKMILVD